MDNVAGNLAQRIEHEPPIPACRMRDLKPGQFDPALAVQDQVHVKRPRAPTDRAGPPEVGLDRLQQVEQLQRRQFGLDLGGSVEKLAACFLADRGGPVHKAERAERHQRLGVQTFQRPVERLHDTTRVATQCQETAGHEISK